MFYLIYISFISTHSRFRWVAVRRHTKTRSHPHHRFDNMVGCNVSPSLTSKYQAPLPRFERYSQNNICCTQELLNLDCCCALDVPQAQCCYPTAVRVRYVREGHIYDTAVLLYSYQQQCRLSRRFSVTRDTAAPTTYITSA